MSTPREPEYRAPVNVKAFSYYVDELDKPNDAWLVRHRWQTPTQEAAFECAYVQYIEGKEWAELGLTERAVTEPRPDERYTYFYGVNAAGEEVRQIMIYPVEKMGRRK